MSKQPLIDQLDRAVAAILADPAGESPAVDVSLVDLLQVARDLRGLPAPSFKARLRSDLERKASMSTQTSTAKVVQYRPGFRSVTPYVLPPSADFIDFAKRAFGDDVIAFSVQTARHEVKAFNAAVTDWERVRYFERI